MWASAHQNLSLGEDKGRQLSPPCWLNYANNQAGVSASLPGHSTSGCPTLSCLQLSRSYLGQQCLGLHTHRKSNHRVCHESQPSHPGASSSDFYMCHRTADDQPHKPQPITCSFRCSLDTFVSQEAWWRSGGGAAPLVSGSHYKLGAQPWKAHGACLESRMTRGSADH